MRDLREFQVLAGEVKNVRWNVATDECVFEIDGIKFNAKIAKERLVPCENDRLAVAYDEQNEVWNFKNLTSGKWLKNYAWHAHFILSWAAIFDIVPDRLYGLILVIPIVCLFKYLPPLGNIILLFVVMICLFVSLPLLCIDDKTPTDKANAYLALRKFLKEADL